MAEGFQPGGAEQEQNAQETIQALRETVDRLQRLRSGLFAAQGLTEQQFNVLRILRAAGPGGLPTLQVAKRLIEQTPGITRLLDRLEAKGMVRRERPGRDRRQCHGFITAAGLEVLERIEPVAEACCVDFLSGLSEGQRKTLDRILKVLRSGNGVPG
jgi:DNA-binding MarR family transcriptional regulator